MLKKLLIAAAAVVVGLVIVKKTDLGCLARVWWKDTSSWAAKQVPLETRIKQLKVKVADIDKDIHAARDRLVKLELDKRDSKTQLDGLKTVQEQRKQDMLTLIEALEQNSTRVVFKGQSTSSEVAQIRLDTLKTEFETGKQTQKLKEKSYGVKSEQVELAHQRLTRIKAKKDELASLADQLDAQLENLRMKQLDARVEIPDSKISEAEKLAAYIRAQFDEEEVKTEVNARYNLEPKTTPAKATPSKAETIKAARAVLADDEKVAGEQ